MGEIPSKQLQSYRTSVPNFKQNIFSLITIDYFRTILRDMKN